MPKRFLRLQPVFATHPAVYYDDRAVSAKQRADTRLKITERVSMLGEDHQLAAVIVVLWLLVLSGRNLPGVRVIADTHLTAYDALDCTHLLVSQEAVEKLEERLGSRG